MDREQLIGQAIGWIVQLHPNIYSKFSERKRQELICTDAEEMAEFVLFINSIAVPKENTVKRDNCKGCALTLNTDWEPRCIRCEGKFYVSMSNRLTAWIESAEKIKRNE